MKTFHLAFASSLLIFFYACGSGNNTPSAGNQPDKDVIESTQCYVAASGADTAYLDLENRSGGKVTGKLQINYSEKPDNNGTIEGEFKGDTLYVNYTFTTGENKTVFKNPLAFLKDSTKLELGVGEIESYLGKSYFKKGTKIDFASGRFKFDSVSCKD
ncbi:MAG: hypothetical protein ACO1NU_09480 [Arcticibacter sp.]